MSTVTTLFKNQQIHTYNEARNEKHSCSFSFGFLPEYLCLPACESLHLLRSVRTHI